MLIYVSTGLRRYGDTPITIHARRGWEFQAVLRGSIAPVGPEGPELLARKKLWLFSPSQPHGWTAEKDREAEVAVFHFLSVPEPLLSLAVKTPEPLSVNLDDAGCQRLRLLARKASRYWESPSPAMMICHEQALMELSLLVYEADSGLNAPHAPESPAWRTVQRAMEIFAENMHDNPSQEWLARKVGASPAHLRRLFHEVLQNSPKHLLDQMRFQRAMQMMADPDNKLESIGEACGFGSASTFSRAFKMRYGCSPQAWRG